MEVSKDFETALRLSYYREVADVDERHAVKLVQHQETGRFFVHKKLELYDLRVYRYLMEQKPPGTPKITDLIEEAGRLHVIEEYIDGQSLRQLLDAGGPLPEKQAVDLLCQVCRILRPLHRLQPPIVHRDIKPSNLILTADRGLFLIDFNSAKASPGNRSQDTVLLGTAGYAAPEQYGFSVSQPTADIFALGVLLNELLTGSLPNEKRYAGRLEKIILKCTQMDASRRYQNVDELLSALGQKQLAGRLFRLRDRMRDWKEWLPPGFRSRRPGRWIGAASWYAFILLSASTLEQNSDSPGRIFLYRVMLFVLLLGLTLFLGNYRDVWLKLPLTSHRHPALRAAGVVLWTLLFLFATILVLALLDITLFS